ncbi:MAG: hypothetical protein EOP49_25120 [Sphingobacteriales bacterium]|nr:MAG: hypothetical protein EOP49_25120 [Sphingobacteriales bacterium]
MKTAAASPSVMAVLLTVFTLYALKCISFMVSRFGNPDHKFLTELDSLPARKQQFLIAACFILLFQPVVIYAGFAVLVAVQESRPVAALAIPIYLVLASAAAILICSGQWNHFRKGWLLQLSERLPAWRTRRTLPKLGLHHLIHDRKITMVILKTISLILLQGMVAYNRDKLSRESVCFFVMILIVAHALIPYYLVGFLEKDCKWLRALPISMFQRFSHAIIAFGALFLPELLFLLLHTSHAIAVTETITIYLLSVSMLCLFFSLLYFNGLTADKYMLFVMVLFMVTLFLMAGIRLPLITVGTFVLSAVIYRIRYTRFQLTPEA